MDINKLRSDPVHIELVGCVCVVRPFKKKRLI